ncbi:hypothetical protein MJO28_015577 [Puccinia striiformis f. sp. tritici]|uniref:Uncharacterized protein n=1 Tax=Puccinia striiformis f. sp. tritici TaxID=168172 RepID=A0ACC0DPC6_9BASI|nr:hypothetical protein MJO28_015577 [Puccinia striiformis f. sp. tritici]
MTCKTDKFTNETTSVGELWMIHMIELAYIRGILRDLNCQPPASPEGAELRHDTATGPDTTTGYRTESPGPAGTQTQPPPRSITPPVRISASLRSTQISCLSYPLEIRCDQLPFPSRTLPLLEYDMVGQTTLDSYFRSPRTSEVASNRSAPNSNNLPANSIGAAAAVLPNVADLFANAFKPLGNTAPTADQADTNQTSVDQPRVNHDNVDPLLAYHTTNDIDPALLPLPSSRTSSHHATSNRSETGASTAAIQEQLTTENVRNLNGRAETQTITGEHSDQESIAIITG